MIKRIVATLQKYEDQVAELSEPDGAENVADLEAARAARQQALEEAATVREEAESATRDRLDEAERQARRRIAEAEDDAAQIKELARADAAKLLSRRYIRADDLITAALSEVKALRARVIHETNEYRAGKKTEATALLRTAELQASQLIEDARHEAGSILGKARRERMMLEQRIGQLRSAIAGIEGQFRHLAESTLEQTEIMSTMISLESEELEALVEPGEPEVVRLTQQDMTVDLTNSHEDPTEEQDKTDDTASDRFVVAPGSTIYQRRGAGLRRRLEDERDDD